MSLSNVHPVSNVSLADLRLGPSSHALLTRVIRLWEVENPYDAADYPALTILMIDEKGSMGHAFLPPVVRDAYYGAIREGGIYKILHYQVLNSTKLYSLTSSPFVILFTPMTSCKQVLSCTIRIPRESFDVHKHDKIMGIANTGLALPDIVGKICIVEGPDLFDPTCTEMITVVLSLQPDVRTTLNLWDNTAAALRNLMSPPSYVKPIIVVTSVNPTIVGGRLTLDSTKATRFFFTNDFTVIKKYGETFGPEDALTFEINDTSKLVRKVESLPIREIINFTMQPGHTYADFLSESMVLDATWSGRNHLACSGCALNMTTTNTSHLWWQCPTLNFIGDDRLHVAFKVFDGSAMATFVITGRELNLFSTAAAGQSNIQLETGVGTETIRDKIEEMVGNIFKFKVRINPYNYSTSQKIFTVASIQTTLAETKPTFAGMPTWSNIGAGLANHY